MTDRKVNLALIAYKNSKGENLYAQRGEEVDVHDDDLDHFDELNEQYGDSGEVEPHPEPGLLGVVESEVHGPGPLDKGGNGNARDELLEMPRVSASKSDWVEYAVQEGEDRDEAEAMSKKELIALLTTD